MLNRKTTNWKFTLGRVLFFWFCCMVVLATVGPLVKQLPKLPSLLLLSTTAAVATFLLTIVFVRWERLRLREVGVVRNRNTFSGVFIGFIVGLVLPLLKAVLVMLTGHVQLEVSPTVTPAPVLLTFLLYLVASCREELAFRGYPLHSLSYVVGPWAAQLIIAFIFGIEHVIGGNSWLNGLAGAGTGSLLYGIVALRTKSLAMPIGIHAAWNFGEWVMGFKGEPGIWRLVVEKGYEDSAGKVNDIGYFVIMGLAIAATHFYWKQGPANDSTFHQESPAHGQ
jgi:membrane protease YdiL (CAAX protease family)